MMLHEKAAVLTKECFNVVDAASFSLMLRYNCWLALKNVRSGERGMQEKCEAREVLIHFGGNAPWCRF